MWTKVWGVMSSIGRTLFGTPGDKDTTVTIVQPKKTVWDYVPVIALGAVVVLLAFKD